MSQQSYEDIDEVLPEEPKGELVHWMQPRPLAFGPAGVSVAVAGAFALGLATAFALLGLLRRKRGMSLPLQRKLRKYS